MTAIFITIVNSDTIIVNILDNGISTLDNIPATIGAKNIIQNSFVDPVASS